jgi:hypothetical protein
MPGRTWQTAVKDDRLEVMTDYQYFTKDIQTPKKIPKNRGVGIRPQLCFWASPGYFVMY